MWEASGVSSFKETPDSPNHTFTMKVIIKQTFTRLEVFTETAESTSRSTMASIDSDHAMAIFRYAFENTPKSIANGELQRHPGLIELRVNARDEMAGDYFSGKHRLRFGELTLRRIK